MRPVASPMRRSLVLGGLMVATAVAARSLAPRPVIDSAADIPDLDRIVPVSFGAWRVDRSIVPLEISPDVARTLNSIYDKTLSRTYVDGHGQRVMLSLAYGANQSRALQLHKPEVCYATQGFRVHSVVKAEIVVDGSPLPVMHLVGEQGPRVEPITYWMRIGNDIARGWFEQNRIRLKYGMRGLIPDGLLFRLSNISTDLPASYAVHEAFASALVGAVSPAQRLILVGDG